MSSLLPRSHNTPNTGMAKHAAIINLECSFQVSFYLLSMDRDEHRVGEHTAADRQALSPLTCRRWSSSSEKS